MEGWTYRPKNRFCGAEWDPWFIYNAVQRTKACEHIEQSIVLRHLVHGIGQLLAFTLVVAAKDKCTARIFLAVLMG